MSQISKTLNMKSLEEILNETDIQEDEPEVAPEKNIAVSSDKSLMTIPQMKGQDHADAMDEIYAESLETARKIIDMGMNIDPARAPRILEVANQWMKTAADAKISKRDAELKLMKLMLDQRKVDLEERGNGANNPEAINGEVVFEGDRNKLLQILRSQRKEKSPDN